MFTCTLGERPEEDRVLVEFRVQTLDSEPTQSSPRSSEPELTGKPVNEVNVIRWTVHLLVTWRLSLSLIGTLLLKSTRPNTLKSANSSALGSSTSY